METVSATLQSLSEQLQVERSRLASFLSAEDPNYVQASETVQHLQSSLDRLGLSLADIPSYEAVEAIRADFQQAYCQAQTVLQIHSEDVRFEDPREDLGELVQLAVEQEQRLLAVSAGCEDAFLVLVTQELVTKNTQKLVERAKEAWAAAVEFSSAGVSLQGKHQALLRMLLALGQRDAELRTAGEKLADMLGRVLAGDSLDEADDGTKLAFARSRHDESLSQLLAQATKLLRFAFVQLCQRDKSSFAALDFPLSGSLLATIKKKIADKDRRGADLQAVVAFAQSLRDFDCAPDVLKEVERICSDTESAVVSIRCEMLIEEVRGLILSTDRRRDTVKDQTERWSYSEKQGKQDDHEGIFVLEEMQVTTNVRRVVEALQTFLEKAASAPAAAALEMVLAVRACVQLFYFLRLHSQESSLRNSHADAALFHNDCLYFSHHLTLIAAEICPKLPEEVRDSCQLCEFRPMLLHRGAECFSVLCSEAERILGENLKSLRSAQVAEEFSKLQDAVQSVASQISVLAGSLDGVLARSDFLRFLGRMVDFALAALLEKIFSLQRISSSEEAALQQLIEEFLGLASLFGRQDPSAHVRNWEKLEVVKKVLENDINGTMKLFAEGRLAKALTPREITTLIEAMFEDSPRRQECLRAMTT